MPGAVLHKLHVSQSRGQARRVSSAPKVSEHASDRAGTQPSLMLKASRLIFQLFQRQPRISNTFYVFSANDVHIFTKPSFRETLDTYVSEALCKFPCYSNFSVSFWL